MTKMKLDLSLEDQEKVKAHNILGIWIDRRPGRVPQIVVCDRAHHSLQYFTMDGKYIETLKGYGLPANIDSWKDLF